MFGIRIYDLGSVNYSDSSSSSTYSLTGTVNNTVITNLNTSLFVSGRGHVSISLVNGNSDPRVTINNSGGSFYLYRDTQASFATESLLYTLAIPVVSQLSVPISAYRWEDVTATTPGTYYWRLKVTLGSVGTQVDVTNVKLRVREHF